MYELDGFFYSLTEIQEAAKKNNISVEEYISSRGMKPAKENLQAMSNQPAGEEPEDKGFFEDLWTATKGGLATGSSVNEAFDVYKQGASISDEDLGAFIEKANQINSQEQTNEAYNFAKSQKEYGGGVFGTLKALYDNPGFAPQFIASSAATMARSLVDSDEVAGATAASAGVGAAAGAGIGSTGFAAGPLGVVTTTGGAITGTIGGAMGGLVGAMETGLTLTELLKDELQGQPFTKQNIRAILENEDAIKRIKNRSVGRGIAIGAVEGLTLGLSRGVGSKMLGEATKKGAVGLGKEGLKTSFKIGGATTGIEMAGGFGGEVAGQAAAGQEIDLGEATLEAIGEAKGVFNVTDIMASALNNPVYKINNEKRSKQEIVDLLNSDLSAAEKAKIKFDVGGDNRFNAFVQSKINDARLETVVDAKITDEVDRKKMVELEKQRAQAEADANKKGISMVPGAKEKLADINEQMETLANKYAGVDGRTKEVRANVKAAKETVEIMADENFEANMEFAKKHSSLYNLEVNDGLTREQIREKFGEEAADSNGFIEGNQIIINKEVAKTTGIDGQNTGNHELLHGIIKASGISIKQDLITDFLNIIGKDNQAVIQQRIDENYNTTVEVNKEQADRLGIEEGTEVKYMEANPDEYFTLFSDAIAANQIKFDETVFTKIKDVVRRLFQNIPGVKVNFDNMDAQGMYDFIRDYNKSIHKGALASGIVKGTKGDGTVDAAKYSLSRKVDTKKVNSDFKSRLDQFTGPAEQRKYSSDDEFKKSQDFANAALALEEDPAVLKKIEKEFIRYNVTPTPNNIADASRILSEKFIKTFDASKNSLFGWAMGKTPVLTKAVNTVIKNETQRPDATATSIDQTFGEDQTKFDIADDVDINDIIQNNIDGKNLRPRSKVGQKTILNGEKLFDDNLVKDLKAKALDVLGKNFDVTSDEFVKFVTSEFNKTIRPVIQKKVGREAAFRKFIEENIDTDGNPFQEGNISLADIVQMEKMETNKVFTEEIQKNLKPTAVDVAIAANKLPKDTNRLSGPTLYKYGKPTVDDIVNFMYSKDIGASTRGTRRDRFYLNLGLRGMFDMLVTQATETNVPQKQIAKLAKKLDVPQNIRFSKSSTYTKVNTKQLADMFSKKFKNVEYYDVNTNVERYANDIVEVAKIFEEKYGAGFLGLSMINNKKGLKINSEQRAQIKEIIKKELPNISKRNSEYSKTKFDKKLIKTKTSEQLKVINKRNMMLHKEFWQTIRDIVSKDKSKIVPLLHMLEISQNEGSHIQRLGAEYIGGHVDINKVEHFEHALQNANTYRMLMDAAVNQSKDNFTKTYKATVKNYKIIGLPNADNNILNATDFKNKMSLDQSWSVFENNWWQRYFNETVGNAGGINPVNLVTLDGNTFAEEFGVDIYGRKSNLAIEQAKNKVKTKYPKVLKFSKSRPTNKILNDLNDYDTALRNAKNLKAPKKGISVFDFDDTLATTKSKIIVNMPDGKVKKITPAEFAKQHSKLEEQGVTFDFNEFNKVVDGKPALASKKLEKAIKKFGNKDVYVLTARPQQAAPAIYEFLKGIGLEIPLKNITGLENGTPQAKANWVVSKAAEGYNDFYFTDDVYKNVKAVQDALEILDVKSKSRIAYVDRVTKLDKDFNDIIEAKTGIAAEKEYSQAKARVVGASKGKFKFFIPPSAEDFVGLLYNTLAKGKLGDNQMAWYKKNLLDPFARANANISRERISLMNDYKALKKQLQIVPKNLQKSISGEPYTNEQAVRVYIWNKQGMTIPGLSKTDLKDLTNYIENKPDLKVFGDQLINIQKGDEYQAPNSGWLAGTITTDIQAGLGSTKRAKHLAEWQQNVDIIFSEKNLNKMEAAFGKAHRTALEGILKRMKTGRNRSFQSDSLTGQVTDWLTNSIGTIMFFNTRSALLQTISAVNFINFKDNNIFKAGLAYANQPQFWSDFMTLMNSDFLVDRRRGLRINVNEADIADMAKQSGARGVISKMLEIGFLPTQIADSFAIASGGATFYRNRIKTYKKQGMSEVDSKEKAFNDFREIAEESQQSSRPDRISAQQAGPLGRIILAFGNTPMQYARLIKKASSDLKNGRGDWKTNVSKIVYYGAIQNLIFNALQQAIFAIAFGDSDEDKEDEKYLGIANGMADSLLRGVGIAGAFTSVGKNVIMRFIKESEKPNPKYEKISFELARISPPISSKLSKLNQAGRALQWEKDEMEQMGLSYENPAWLAGANVISAATNIPVDRLVKKVTNVANATGQDVETWERIALLGGWQDWELDMTDDRKKKKTNNKKKKAGPTRIY